MSNLSSSSSSNSNSSSSSCSCFIGICLCATGITSKEEKIIQVIINELGGKYSPNFTSSITHLIVKKVGSKKHAVRYLSFFLLPSLFLISFVLLISFV